MSDWRELLQYRPFRWLVAARTIDFVGNGMAPIALAFAVLDLTGSATDLGLVVGARSVANVALLLFGGMLADRLPRHTVLQGSALLGATSQACAAASMLCGFSSVSLLIVIGGLNGMAAAVSLPAASAIVPKVVPANLLRPANALVGTGMSAATVAGTSIGGALVVSVGSGWGLAVDALSFVAVAICYTRIHLSPAQRSRDALSPWQELRAGWTAFISRSWLWAVVLQFMVLNAAINGFVRVLGPAIADETIGRAAWGLVLAAQTLGAVAGGLLALRWQPNRALFFGVITTLFAIFPPLMLAHHPHTVTLVIANFAFGTAIQQFSVAWVVSLQQNIPDDMLAKVYSYDAVGSFLAIPIGQIAAGPIANTIGAVATLDYSAMLIIVATAATLIVPQVRHLSSTPTKR